VKDKKCFRRHLGLSRHFNDKNLEALLLNPVLKIVDRYFGHKIALSLVRITEIHLIHYSKLPCENH
jgi:hypothetical protein